jgi:hypothetical protein
MGRRPTLMAGMGVVALGAALLLGPAPALADKSDKTDKKDSTRDLAAQSRITIYPRKRPGPNSKRHCRAWLAKEYRVSGTVITPQMQCWWD